MITNVEFRNLVMKDVNRLTGEFDKKVSLYEKYKDVIKELESEHIIDRARDKDELLSRYSSIIARVCYRSFTYVDKEVSNKDIENYLKNRNENELYQALDRQHQANIKYFNRLWTIKNNKYSTVEYDSYNYKFKVINCIEQFLETVGITNISKEDFKEWDFDIEKIFEIKNLKIKVYKNNKIEITVKPL